ncbi:hypothetical protein [Sphingobium sp.]|uniref:hypothetical protein n=1 Tax=Sphingobium sp. TaxID=1912891 RepID=UPI003BB6043C
MRGSNLKDDSRSGMIHLALSETDPGFSSVARVDGRRMSLSQARSTAAGFMLWATLGRTGNWFLKTTGQRQDFVRMAGIGALACWPEHCVGLTHTALHALS